MSASSAAVAGSPSTDANFSDATDWAAAPFASGVPTVRNDEAWTGGVHEGNASGGAWVRFGAMHGSKAGTSETRIGVAPAGRG